MNFLAPLFLLGAGAVALPLIFHLIRRTTRERTPFSSLIFLTPSPPRLTQRSRLEDLLLLLLRCLAIALLAFGFARPFLPDNSLADPTDQPPLRQLHLVDISASMQRDGLWEAAVERVIAEARAASPADEMAVWTFDRQVHPLVPFSEWAATPPGERPALVRSRLASTQPGWSTTHLDDALTLASEGLVETSDQPFHGRRRLVLVSDLQEGSRLERLQAFEWPEGVEIAIAPLKARHSANAGLQILAESPTAPATTQSVVRVRVSNAADSDRAQFAVGWARADAQGFLGRAEEVQVPPGQSRVVTLPLPVGAPVQEILLRGDEEPFDNQAYVVPPSAQPIRALYLGADAQEEVSRPLYFLRRALPPTGRLAVALAVPEPSPPLDPAAARAAGVYFVTADVPEATARLLRDEVATGKTLVFAPPTAAAMAGLGPLLGIARVPVEEAKPRKYAMLAAIDFQHPLLAPFADPRFNDFTRVHFWKYRRVRLADLPGARAPARFDSGDPALIEVPVDRGRVIVLTSGWHPEDSQLGVSTKFVPLVCSLCQFDAGLLDAGIAYTVGDVLPVPLNPGEPSTMRCPDGTLVNLAAGTTNFTETLLPGIYQLTSPLPIRRYAVNIDARESRTAPLPVENLEALGAPLRPASPAEPPVTNPERRRQIAAAEAEGRQKLWRWLIVAALAVLVSETILAGWKTRRLTLRPEAVP